MPPLGSGIPPSSHPHRTGTSRRIRRSNPAELLHSLLLDSRVVEWSMAYNLTFVILSSLKPLFFNSLKHELRFSGHVGA
jgi:hypothetical protein